MVQVTTVALDLDRSAEVLRVMMIQTKIHFRIHYFAQVCSPPVLSISSEAYAPFQDSSYNVTITYL